MSGRQFWEVDPSEHITEGPGWGRKSKPNGKFHAPGEAIPFTLFADVEPALDLGDFVEDLLTSSSLAVVFGEPGCGKTFWVLDICLHVAAGLPWQGRAVEQGAVIYFALEGGGGIRNRISAARVELDLPASTPFVLIQQPLNLCTNTANRADIISTIEAVTERLGMPVRLVVIDTLARALAGGNENSPEDMGALVANADQIRHATGVCLLFIHHSGKDVERGSRGHSSLKGANDTEIEVIKAEDGTSVAAVTRQRDLESGACFAFKLTKVELGRNPRGKAVTSCTVTPRDAPDAPPQRGKARGASHTERAYEVLASLCAAEGATGYADVPAGFSSVPEDWWRDRFYDRAMPGAEQPAKRQAFHRASKQLIGDHRVGMAGKRVWIAYPTAA